MITVQGYVKAKQPAEYAELEQRYPLPVLPSWAGGVRVVKESRTTEQGPEEELTPRQRWLDKLMRRKPRPGRGE